MDKNYENFRKLTQGLFEEGLLKEIYVSDNVSICNTVDCFYSAFILNSSGKELKDIWGFQIGSAYGLRIFVLHEYEILTSINDNPGLRKRLYHLDDRIINAMRERAEETKKTGPKKIINYEVEALLKEAFNYQEWKKEK